MTHVSAHEIERQYRVLRQTLGIHGILRDEYGRKVKIAEGVLVVASVIFCSTTFAGDELFATLWRDPGVGRVALGIVSVAAFAASLVVLLVDWKGSSARHADAIKRWDEVLRLFRERRREDGSWSPDDFAEPNAAYWRATRESAEIPGRQFNALKSKHLQRVAVSELKSRFPGCPRLVLAVIVKVRATGRAIKNDDGAATPA